MRGAHAVFIAARPEVLDSLIKLIDQTERLSLAGTAQSGDECLRKLVDSGAQIALIDFALPEISGVKVIEYVSAQDRQIISVLVSDQSNPEFFRSGMLAGAREFIILPTSPGDLEFFLERVVQVAGAGQDETRTRSFAAQSQRDARVVVGAGAKGGVGLSFVAANLAKLMAEEEPGASIALIDFNYRANDLAVIANVEPRKTLNDVVSVVADLDPSLLRTVGHSLAPNLDLFAAPIEPAVDDIFSPDQIGLLVEAWRSSYDLVIVDNGAYAKSRRSRLFEAADLILIVLTAEVLAVRGGKRLVDCLERLGISKNNLLAVVNRWGLFSLPLDRVAEFIGVPVTEKLPESDAVKFLLDEGRLLRSADKTDVKLALDQLSLAIRQKLSLGDGISVR